MTSPTTASATPREPTFLLGVGCMKGGTTWLHDHLAGSPRCEPGYRKEYHVWDSLDLPEPPFLLGRIAGRAVAAAEAVGRRQPADAAVLHHASLIADPELYFDYFAALSRRSPGVHLSLDITPGYAMLSAERYAAIREGFERRGIRTVAVFLMRDPVERIWSQVRMQLRRRPLEATAEQLVLERHREPTYAERSRFETTVRNLDAAFGADEVHYGFYERLHDPAHLRALADLTGIGDHAADPGRSFNVSPKAAPLPAATTRIVAEHFRDTYAFVAQRFDVDLARLWPNSRLLG